MSRGIVEVINREGVHASTVSVVVNEVVVVAILVSMVALPACPRGLATGLELGQSAPAP